MEMSSNSATVATSPLQLSKQPGLGAFVITNGIPARIGCVCFYMSNHPKTYETNIGCEIDTGRYGIQGPSSVCFRKAMTIPGTRARPILRYGSARTPIPSTRPRPQTLPDSEIIVLSSGAVGGHGNSRSQPCLHSRICYFTE
ncbi:hypothetical protein J6590_026257 [Homalodisca vitripennis]|nr:hypothetical protein J6590_026257 [Homalodisca vitripennis]